MRGVRPTRIYLDYAATTPVDPRVVKAMAPYWGKVFGNPSSLHAEGVLAKKALQNARALVARVIRAHAPEIIFTGSGTEANNLALFGVIDALEKKGVSRARMHSVTSSIEHESVLRVFNVLEETGVSVTYVEPDASGVTPLEPVIAAIRENTVLISLMYVNHEIGAVNPVPELGKRLRDLRSAKGTLTPLFHSDASQAATLLNVAVDRLGVDLLTLDAQKMYGPKGVGVLYVREGTPLAPIVQGGGQERGWRSGTEAVPLAVGCGAALSLAEKGREREYARLSKLRDFFIERLLATIPGAAINGNPRRSLPSIVNVSLPGYDSEMMALRLDALGVALSTKSACQEGSERASHVVLEVTRSEEKATSSLRFSFGVHTTKADLAAALRALLSARAVENI
jgi:cysteine desulfurase